MSVLNKHLDASRPTCGTSQTMLCQMGKAGYIFSLALPMENRPWKEEETANPILVLIKR